MLSLCATLWATQNTPLNLNEQPEHLDWDTSVETEVESHLKPSPNLVWIQFAKTAFHVFFFADQILNLWTFGLAENSLMDQLSTT